MRSMSVGVPSSGLIATREENATRARVWEKRAKTSPVASAVAMRLATDSATTSMFARRVAGYIAPYPIVPIVWMLKKNASRNEPGAAFAIPPTTAYTAAKAALSARYETTMKPSAAHHGTRRRR
jgi:hypothetical protein